MRKKSGPQKATTEQVVKDIRRKTRKVHSAEEKIRMVLADRTRPDPNVLCRISHGFPIVRLMI